VKTLKIALLRFVTTLSCLR